MADRILRFLPHQPLDLEIELSSACVGVKCDAMQTCVRGTCIDIPSNVPPADPDAGPRDAGPALDATILDASNDGLTPVDGSLGDGGLVDAGKCPSSPLNTTDIHWGFNEGVLATTIADDTMAYSASLIANVTLMPNAPCNTALSYSGSVLQNLSTTNWQPTPTLGIAFELQYISGVGTILERNAKNPGGWRFSVVNQKLVFDLWDDQAKSTAPPSVTLVGGKTRVVGTYSQGLVTLSAYNSNASQGLSLNLSGYNADIFLGMQGIKFVIDELWLGH